MAINFTTSDDFELFPEGNFIVELKKVEVSMARGSEKYGTEPEPAIAFLWEDEDGNTLYDPFNRIKFTERSSLGKRLKALVPGYDARNGHDFSLEIEGHENLDGLPIFEQGGGPYPSAEIFVDGDSLLGRQVQVEVFHKTNEKGNTFAKVGNIMALPQKGRRAPA